MTFAERLEAAIYEVTTGRRAVFSTAPAFCLKVVRQTIAPALGLDPEDAWGFHERYSYSRVEGNETGAAHARSTQRTLRDEFGWGVPYAERRVGDLAFNAALDPRGHVGVITAVTATATTVLENTSSKRGTEHDGFNRLSKLEAWPRQSQIQLVRLRESDL